MNGSLKRLFVAGAAIASLSTALLFSGAAYSKPYAGGSASDLTQMEPTNVSPADPDASIRGQGN
jgi:hypothetical protein